MIGDLPDRVRGANVAISGGPMSSSFVSDTNDFYWFTLLLCLVGGVQLAGGFAVELLPTLNILTPCLVLIAGTLCAWRSLTWQPSAFLSPLPWFYLGAALLYGLGPLVWPLQTKQNEGASVSQEWMMWQGTTLSVISLATVSLTIKLTSSLFKGASRQMTRNRLGQRAWPADWLSRPRVAERMVIWALAFIATGELLKFTVVLPYDFGMIDTTLPGSVRFLANLVPVGVLMFAISVARRPTFLGVLGLASIMSAEFVVELLRFSKLAVVMAILIPVVGCYVGSGRRVVLVVGFVAAIMAFVVVTPVVSTGRAFIAQNDVEEDYNRATISERWEILKLISDMQRRGELQTDSHSSWSRICYTQWQSTVMSWYDSGRSGDSYKYIPYIFVPRVFWKNKPIINAGAEFYQEVTGRTGSSIGLTVFGEAYYNFGWMGAIVASAFIGFLIALAESLSAYILRNAWFVAFPLLFVGMMWGSSTDGWIQPSYIHPAVQGGLMLSFLYLFFRPTKEGSTEIRTSLGAEREFVYSDGSQVTSQR